METDRNDDDHDSNNVTNDDNNHTTTSHIYSVLRLEEYLVSRPIY